jgi:hypothetical protein
MTPKQARRPLNKPPGNSASASCCVWRRRKLASTKPVSQFGDILETGSGAKVNAKE